MIDIKRRFRRIDDSDNEPRQSSIPLINCGAFVDNDSILLDCMRHEMSVWFMTISVSLPDAIQQQIDSSHNKISSIVHGITLALLMVDVYKHFQHIMCFIGRMYLSSTNGTQHILLRISITSIQLHRRHRCTNARISSAFFHFHLLWLFADAFLLSSLCL